MGQLLYFFNTYGVFLLIIVAILFATRQKKSKQQIIRILLACLISGLIALFLKILFNIPRPYQAEHSLALAGLSLHTTSLPSIHTTLAFAVSTIVALHSNKKAGILFLVLAAFVGFGRVIAYVHYPIDVGLGALLGASVAFILDLRVDL